MADPGPPRYRFGPLERRGLVAGWRGGQIATVAVGLVVAVGILRAKPSPVGAFAAFAVVAGAAVIATWPVGGRTVEQWMPEVARHSEAVRRQRRRRLRQRDAFSSLRLLDVALSSARSRAGIVHDPAAQTYTVVLRVTGPGFVLLGTTEKSRRIGGWSGVLASLAREATTVHRLQWVERSRPDDGAEVRSHIATRAVLDGESGPGRSYEALVASEVAIVHRHEVLLTLTVHAGQSGRAVRAAGGGEHGACAVVLREAASVARRLAETGLDVGGVLDPESLSVAVRAGFDADMPSTAVAPTGGAPGPGTPARAGLGPLGLHPEWGRVRTDGTWHATYWIAEWPRTDVEADFLAPLLLVSDVRRAVAVVMEPVAPLRAARRIEQARTADIADAELRRRGGFLATARRQHEEDVLVAREGELADGHASFRFSGYVTVSVTEADALEEACGRIEQAAGQAGLELRRCYGDQAVALTCTLPLGRGLA